jgi:hypothetical protein
MIIDNQTVFIDIENHQYPLYLDDIRQALPQFTLPDHPPEDLLRKLGFAVVTLTDKPSGDVVDEMFPLMTPEGKFYQEWRARNFTVREKAIRLEEQRKNSYRKLDAQYTLTIQNGYPYKHQGETVRVVLADQGRSLMTELVVESKLRMDEGNDSPLRINVRDRLFIALSPRVTLGLARKALDYCRFVDAEYQDLKLRIRGARDESDLPVIEDDLLGNPVVVPVTEILEVDPIGGIDSGGNLVDHC